MKYKEVKVENKKHIIIDNGDGSYKSFPADESNPEYVAFMSEINGTPITQNPVVEDETRELEIEAE
jgi:hypothetical protein